jgi:hypothetical protein
MCRNLVAGMAALAALASTASLVRAQDSSTAQLYGVGVHAFFQREYQKAHEAFTSAIEEGAQDARCYYFRGLTCLRTGRLAEAAEDFKKGAELEAAGDDRFLADSDSLQRIQGEERLKLEQYRQTARALVRQRAAVAEKARREQLRREQEEALRKAEQLSAAATPPIPETPAAGGAGPSAGQPAAAAVETQAKATETATGMQAKPTAILPKAAREPLGAAAATSRSKTETSTSDNPFAPAEKTTPPSLPVASGPAADAGAADAVSGSTPASKAISGSTTRGRSSTSAGADRNREVNGAAPSRSRVEAGTGVSRRQGQPAGGEKKKRQRRTKKGAAGG